MNRNRLVKLCLAALCGGTLLQTSGCSTTLGTLASSLIPQLIFGLLSGFIGI